jgi:hypothetical protein
MSRKKDYHRLLAAVLPIFGQFIFLSQYFSCPPFYIDRLKQTKISFFFREEPSNANKSAQKLHILVYYDTGWDKPF